MITMNQQSSTEILSFNIGQYPGGWQKTMRQILSEYQDLNIIAFQETHREPDDQKHRTWFEDWVVDGKTWHGIFTDGQHSQGCALFVKKSQSMKIIAYTPESMSPYEGRMINAIIRVRRGYETQQTISDRSHPEKWLTDDLAISVLYMPSGLDTKAKTSNEYKIADKLFNAAMRFGQRAARHLVLGDLNQTGSRLGMDRNGSKRKAKWPNHITRMRTRQYEDLARIPIPVPEAIQHTYLYKANDEHRSARLDYSLLRSSAPYRVTDHEVVPSLDGKPIDRDHRPIRLRIEWLDLQRHFDRKDSGNKSYIINTNHIDEERWATAIQALNSLMQTHAQAWQKAVADWNEQGIVDMRSTMHTCLRKHLGVVSPKREPRRSDKTHSSLQHVRNIIRYAELVQRYTDRDNQNTSPELRRMSQAEKSKKIELFQALIEKSMEKWVTVSADPDIEGLKESLQNARIKAWVKRFHKPEDGHKHSILVKKRNQLRGVMRNLRATRKQRSITNKFRKWRRNATAMANAAMRATNDPPDIHKVLDPKKKAVVCDRKTVEHLFCTYYKKKYSKRKYARVQESIEKEKKLNPQRWHSMFSPWGQGHECKSLMTVPKLHEVLTVIQKANRKAGPGHDGIPHIVWYKLTHQKIPEEAAKAEEAKARQNEWREWTLLYTRACLQRRNKPNYDKVVLFTPVPKPGKTEPTPKNARPITLFNSLSKIPNFILVARWRTILLSHPKLIHRSQQAFLPRRGTYQVMRWFIDTAFIALVTNAPLYESQEDIVDGYGSVATAWFKECGTACGAPPEYMEFCKNQATDQIAMIRTWFGMSKQFPVATLIQQGDPLGPINWAISYNPLVRLSITTIKECKASPFDGTDYKIEHPHTVETTTFGDDHRNLASSAKAIEKVTKARINVASVAGMKLHKWKITGQDDNHTCWSEHLSSYWKRKLVSKQLEVRKRTDATRFVGLYVSLDLNWNNQEVRIEQSLNRLRRAAHGANLTPTQVIYTWDLITARQIEYRLRILPTNASKLREWDRKIQKIMRYKLGLGKRHLRLSPIEHLFQTALPSTMFYRQQTYWIWRETINLVEQRWSESKAEVGAPMVMRLETSSPPMRTHEKNPYREIFLWMDTNGLKFLWPRLPAEGDDLRFIPIPDTETAPPFLESKGTTLLQNQFEWATWMNDSEPPSDAEDHKSTINIYTDGSLYKEDQKAGSAIVLWDCYLEDNWQSMVEDSDEQLVSRVANRPTVRYAKCNTTTSSYHVEIQAILDAHVSLAGLSHRKVVIHTDSESSVRSLQDYKSSEWRLRIKQPAYIQKEMILKAQERWADHNVTFELRWTKSHTDQKTREALGNRIADLLAKKAAKEQTQKKSLQPNHLLPWAVGIQVQDQLTLWNGDEIKKKVSEIVREKELQAWKDSASNAGLCTIDQDREALLKIARRLKKNRNWHILEMLVKVWTDLMRHERLIEDQKKSPEWKMEVKAKSLFKKCWTRLKPPKSKKEQWKLNKPGQWKKMKILVDQTLCREASENPEIWWRFLAGLWEGWTSMRLDTDQESDRRFLTFRGREILHFYWRKVYKEIARQKAVLTGAALPELDNVVESHDSQEEQEEELTEEFEEIGVNESLF